MKFHFLSNLFIISRHYYYAKSILMISLRGYYRLNEKKNRFFFAYFDSICYVNFVGEGIRMDQGLLRNYSRINSTREQIFLSSFAWHGFFSWNVMFCMDHLGRLTVSTIIFTRIVLKVQMRYALSYVHRSGWRDSLKTTGPIELRLCTYYIFSRIINQKWSFLNRSNTKKKIVKICKHIFQ